MFLVRLLETSAWLVPCSIQQRLCGSRQEIRFGEELCKKKIAECCWDFSKVPINAKEGKKIWDPLLTSDSYDLGE